VTRGVSERENRKAGAGETNFQGGTEHTKKGGLGMKKKNSNSRNLVQGRCGRGRKKGGVRTWFKK